MTTLTDAEITEAARRLDVLGLHMSASVMRDPDQRAAAGDEFAEAARGLLAVDEASLALVLTAVEFLESLPDDDEDDEDDGEQPESV